MLSCILPYVILPKIGLGIEPPSVSLAAETLIPNVFPGFNLTNGTTSLIIVTIIVAALMLYVNHTFTSQSIDDYVPKNAFVTLVYWIVQFWDNQVELDRKQKLRILPLVLTIFVFFSVANLIKMIPGTETVGITECAKPGQIGYPIHYGFLDTNNSATVTEAQFEECEETHQGLFTIVAFFKPLTTDINTPLAVAVITIFSVQIWGFLALGLAYILKFINVKALGHGQIIGVVIGGIESISELTKPISLTLRITFAIFAGGILLMVISYLLGAAGAFLFYMIELVVGLFQAFIFSMLTLVYGSQAIHHEE